MTTLKNTTGTKAMKIFNNECTGFTVCYVQIYKGVEDLLHLKSFPTEKKATAWANKILTFDN